MDYSLCLSGTSTFVAPVLAGPSDLDWTQVVEQGNTYSLTLEPESSSILVNSSSPIHNFGFVFHSTPMYRAPDDTFELLTATVRVLADGEVFKEYEYQAKPLDQISMPLEEEISIE